MGWSSCCYDFATAADAATWRTAYLRYVEWMVDLFQPRYLNIGIELNLFLVSCPSSWEGMVDVVNAAYDAAKMRRPSAVVFPSIQIDALYGLAPGSCPVGVDAGTCYDEGYAHLARVKRDRFRRLHLSVPRGDPGARHPPGGLVHPGARTAGVSAR